MTIVYFQHYDRESRGRRVLMALIAGVHRRLARGESVNWARVRQFLLVADPNLRRKRITIARF
jgi:hypothetical protein